LDLPSLDLSYAPVPEGCPYIDDMGSTVKIKSYKTVPMSWCTSPLYCIIRNDPITTIFGIYVHNMLEQLHKYSHEFR